MHHFLALVLSKSVRFMGMLGKMASVTRKADLVCGKKTLGSEKPFDCTIARCCVYTTSR